MKIILKIEKRNEELKTRKGEGEEGDGGGETVGGKKPMKNQYYI